MIDPKGLVKAVAVSAALTALLTAGTAAADKVSDAAKVYQAQLEAMKGQAPPKILDLVASWKFELIDAWMADAAASLDFQKHNKGKTKFSKKEIAELLGPPGKYKFALYGLQVAADSATMGTIDEMGMSYQKDSTVNLEVFTVVRLTFRDDQLVDVRTWPKLQSSSVAGGTWYLRRGPLR
jgi:hypothetical protein